MNKQLLHSPMSLVVILMLTTSSCEKNSLPNADFQILNDDCYAPCQVTFDNLSENGTAYLWDFGDGQFSEEFSPSHIYSAPGNYWVRLKAVNENGEDETIYVANIGNEMGPNSLQKDLLLYYKFDLSPTIDFSGNDNVYSWVPELSEDSPSIIGQSMDAVHSSIRLPELNSGASFNQYAVNLWLKIGQPLGIDPNTQSILKWKLLSTATTQGDFEYFLGLNNVSGQSDISLSSEYRHNSYPDDYFSTDTNIGIVSEIGFDQWHMLTIIEDESLLIYIDGILIANQPNISLFSYGSINSKLSVGRAEYNSQEPFIDSESKIYLIDNIRLYDRALESSDIEMIYSIEKK